MSRSLFSADLNLLESARSVTVVIPVYNGGSVVRECIESVCRHTPSTVDIVVLDDCSTDSASLALLADLEATGRVRVIRSAVNLGYTRNANRGLQLAGERDVVLLNSDTVVGPSWLSGLRRVAYSNASVAAVCAVSDNAGAMSLPVPGALNHWGVSNDWDRVSRVFLQSDLPLAIEVPTIHGFCVYLRRDAIEEVGGFDEQAFPRGYGEENDWSMRARARGWTCLLAPRVMVHHAQGASFGQARAQLIAGAREQVNVLHPTYTGEVRSWLSGHEMESLRDSSQELMVLAQERVALPRRLYVLHASSGGTPETNRDLMKQLIGRQESFVLLAKEGEVAIHRFTAEGMTQERLWKASPRFAIQDTWRSDYADFVARAVVDFGIELVHIRHLINQPLTTVSEVCSRLGVPVVLSTHDFYYICPTVNLLDGDLTYCGGVCTPGHGRCQLPNRFTSGAINLKHDWIKVWRKRSAEVLDVAERVIVTTSSAEQIYAKNYPRHTSKLVRIEHGRDLDGSWQPVRERTSRRSAGPLRVVCPANWAPHKGSDLVNQLIETTHPLVEWHIFGKGTHRISGKALRHGEYERESFGALMREIDPDFIGLFSIWPETYSHTLTEAWALGVPVLSTNIGAIADRISEHGGGRLFELSDPSQIVQFLVSEARALLADKPVERAVAEPSFRRSAKTMAEEYRALYESINDVESRPTIGTVLSSGPGARHVRVESRAARVSPSQVRFKSVDPRDFVLGSDGFEYDALLVQRDAVPANMVNALAERASQLGVRLVYELDDDLLPPAQGGTHRSVGESGATATAILELASAADSVITSTVALQERLQSHGILAQVFENLVDHDSWRRLGPPAASGSEDVTDRWVYWGSETHTEDLLLVQEAFERARRNNPELQLDVIGVTNREADWYQRIVVPRGAHEYPRFSRWMARTRQQRGWKAAIAPLVESGFNESKSDLKILESLALGLPIVASDVGPYRRWADRRSDSVLVTPNDVESWSDAIRSLKPLSPEEQRRLLKGRTLDDAEVNRKWVDVILTRPTESNRSP